MAIPIVSFTAGGIDVESIVQGLMQVERQPINQLQLRQQKAQLQNDALSRLRSSLDSLKSMANSVITNGVGKLASSVSSERRLGQPLTVRPRRLGHVHRRQARTRPRAAHGDDRGVELVGHHLGLDVRPVHQCGRRSASRRCRPESASRPGNYTVSVLQATAGATRTGTSPLAASTLIDGTNNTLNLELDGVAKAVTIASGTYDAAGLLGAVKTALVAAGGGATAALDATGRLRLTSTHEGSAATLQVMGGGSATRPARPHRLQRRNRHRRIDPDRYPARRHRDVGRHRRQRRRPDRERRHQRHARRRSARRRGQRHRGLDRRSQPGECRGGDQQRQRRRQRGRRQGRRRSMDPPALIEPIGHRQRDGTRRDRLRWRRRAAADLGCPGRADHDRHRCRRLFGRRLGQHVHRCAQRSDAHRHRRVGDPCHRQRGPRRRRHRGRGRATHRRRQQPARRHQAADRATTRPPRPLRR